MKLISVDYLNYCQFDYMKLDFTAGLNALVGKNGSGKTNAMNGIYSTITGDFGRNDGVKLDNIRQQANADDRSRITVTLEHDGNHILIARGLRPASVNLQITNINGNVQTITKVTDANEALYTILGVSPKMLADYVFVDQWAIFDFLSMQPSDRAKAFQRLFKTERAESIWKILGEHIDSLSISSKPTAARELLEDRISSTITQLAEKNNALNQLSSKISSTHTDGLLHIVDIWKQKQTLLNEVNQIRTTCKVKEENMRVYSDKAALFISKTDSLVTRLTAQEAAYNQAKNDQISWKTYDTAVQQRDQLVDRLNTLDQTHFKEPVRPKGCYDLDSVEYADLSDIVSKMKNELLICEDYDSKISANAGICPLCNSDVSVPFKHNKEHIAKLKKDIAINEKVLIASNKYAQEMQTYLQATLKHKELKETLEWQLNNFYVTNSQPLTPKNSIDKIINDYEQLAKELKPLQAQLKEQQAKYNELNSVHEYLTKQSQEKYAQYLQLDQTITEDDAERAQLLLDELEKFNKQKEEYQTTIKLLENELTKDQSILAQLSHIETKEQITLQWADHCKAVRDILHRDNLPRLVALNYLDLMQEEINELLERFESPFSVTADTNLSFVAHFKDGRKIPTGRLSGGEKVLLALAFRVVVNDIFAKDLGLLVLDEPTSGLDEGNLRCIRIAMERLKELSASRGLQVVMVTHEQGLINIFDNVIEIK